MYGISQNPNTKNYIIVLNINNYCEKCGEKYTNIVYKWCKPCQINYLKNGFTNWTSGNEEINDFIQNAQLDGMVLEWIPYNQFDNIKETSKNDFKTVHSATWKDGPLCYDKN